MGFYPIFIAIKAPCLSQSRPGSHQGTHGELSQPWQIEVKISSESRGPEKKQTGSSRPNGPDVRCRAETPCSFDPEICSRCVKKGMELPSLNCRQTAGTWSVEISAGHGQETPGRNRWLRAAEAEAGEEQPLGLRIDWCLKEKGWKFWLKTLKDWCL